MEYLKWEKEIIKNQHKSNGDKALDQRLNRSNSDELQNNGDNSHFTSGFQVLKAFRFMKMKSLYLFLVIASVMVLWSCNEDEGYDPDVVRISLGMLEQSNRSTFGYMVCLDNGDTLLPAFSSFYTENEDSIRVLANYTLLGEVDQSTNTFWARINYLSEVLYKRPVRITTSNSDSLGNDPIEIQDLWISGDKLNIEFTYYGGGKVHYINLGYTTPNDDSSPLIFELRHNSRNDLKNYYLNGLVSFNLNEFRMNQSDSVQFEVKVNTFDQTTKTYTGIYHY